MKKANFLTFPIRSAQNCQDNRAKAKRTMNFWGLTFSAILFNLFLTTFTVASTPVKLENDFQFLLDRFLSEVSSGKQPESNLSIEELLANLISIAVVNKSEKGENLQSSTNTKLIQLVRIRQNLDTLIENLDDKQQILLINTLLELNDQTTAKLVSNALANYNDSYQTTLLSIEFAENSYRRNEWAEVINILNKDLESLPLQSLEKSYFLKAVALQKLRQHRDSLKYYELIPESSDLYELAQLNKAIALIRQDWWSDAHSVINKLIKSKTLNEQDELTNRLYLMIGYSLLRNEYLREARQAFRSITLDSKYLTKSLFGISLVAIKQKDFQGAMNSLRLIQEKNEDNLESYEVNLLLPLIYQNLGQTKSAIDGYESAVQFYQNKNQEIELLNGRQLISSTTDFTLPNSCHSKSNRVLLDEMLSFELSKKLRQDIEKLRSDYFSCARESRLKEVEAVKTALQSYLSQARFALAKLYDNRDE